MVLRRIETLSAKNEVNKKDDKIDTTDKIDGP